MKLIKSELDALTCPEGRRDAMFMDEDLKGFGVRVNATGSKSFFFQYKLSGGAVRRLLLGKYGELTPAAARKMAEVARGAYLAGRDPAGERQARRDEAALAVAARKAADSQEHLTLGGLIDRWLAGQLKDASESHRRDSAGSIRRHFARELDRPAQELEAVAVQLKLDQLDQEHPTSARRLRTYGNTMFGWALSRRLVTHNPFDGVVVDSREKSRERVLTDLELGAIWRAAGAMPYPFGPYFRLMILTLQRRAEVLGMRWSEISDTGRTWTLPGDRMKNEQAHIVHLVPEALAILRQIPRWQDPVTGALSPFVFTTNGRTHCSSAQKPLGRLRRLAAIEMGAERVGSEGRAGGKGQKKRGKKADAVPASQWQLHDFRRTGVTVMAQLQADPHIADRVLSHKPKSLGTVAMIYQRHEFGNEQAEVLELWARHVLAVAKMWPEEVEDAMAELAEQA